MNDGPGWVGVKPLPQGIEGALQGIYPPGLPMWPPGNESVQFFVPWGSKKIGFQGYIFFEMSLQPLEEGWVQAVIPPVYRPATEGVCPTQGTGYPLYLQDNVVFHQPRKEGLKGAVERGLLPPPFSQVVKNYLVVHRETHLVPWAALAFYGVYGCQQFFCVDMQVLLIYPPFWHEPS